MQSNFNKQVISEMETWFRFAVYLLQSQRGIRLEGTSRGLGQHPAWRRMKLQVRSGCWELCMGKFWKSPRIEITHPLWTPGPIFGHVFFLNLISNKNLSCFYLWLLSLIILLCTSEKNLAPLLSHVCRCCSPGCVTSPCCCSQFVLKAAWPWFGAALDTWALMLHGVTLPRMQNYHCWTSEVLFSLFFVRLSKSFPGAAVASSISTAAPV